MYTWLRAWIKSVKDKVGVAGGDDIAGEEVEEILSGGGGGGGLASDGSAMVYRVQWFVPDIRNFCIYTYRMKEKRKIC